MPFTRLLRERRRDASDIRRSPQQRATARRHASATPHAFSFACRHAAWRVLFYYPAAAMLSMRHLSMHACAKPQKYVMAAQSENHMLLMPATFAQPLIMF